VQEVAWRWCNEDYDTADRLPFVGQPDPQKSPEFYVATGFNGWGIRNGTAAGLSIAEEIASGAKLWERLYDPCRPVPEDFHRSGDTQSLVADISLRRLSMIDLEQIFAGVGRGAIEGRDP
jgi:hypothetical protein